MSAKPTEAEREGIKHHLIDILSPNQEFSAGDFVNLAKNIINNTDKNIIISGGSWFYIKSLLDKKMLPPISPNKELRKELENNTNLELWEILNNLDPKRALEIHPNNKDKIIRSIEMCKYLNMPISSYKREDNEAYSANWYMPNISRENLYERINLRVDEMIKQGLFEEWQKNKKNYPQSSVLFNTIGYKEFFELEEGLYTSFKEAEEKIKQHTRNFAKRQLTYFKTNKDIKLIQNEDEIIKDLSQ